jgi:ATP-binding cassette, subfamily G (WHITE), member 2, PDR
MAQPMNQREAPEYEGKTEVSPSESDTDAEKYEDLDRTTTGNTYAPINAGDRRELTRLATQFSRTASTIQDESLRRTRTVDIPEDDPALDPASKSFDIYKWVRVFIRAMDEEGIRTQRAGIVFKNLNVSGSGAALQLQQTVIDILVAPLRFRELVGPGRKQHKSILRDFSGVLKSGELLVVLGRPGSGCSTFLKSLCGELHGLEVAKGSKIHYNGTVPHLNALYHDAFADPSRDTSKADDEGVQRGSSVQPRGRHSPKYFLLQTNQKHD